MDDALQKQITQQIKNKLEQAFCPSYLELINESHLHRGHQKEEVGVHLRLILVTEQVAHVPLLERERSVYRLLKEDMKHNIHALSMRIYTSKEWQDESQRTKRD